MIVPSMQPEKGSKVARISAFIYGIVCCEIFSGTFLYAVGFVGNLIVPRSIDLAANTTLTNALVINFSLLELVSTFWINHFDLFGLRQVYLYLIGREYTQLHFATPSLYKLVRHPVYVGWLFALMGCSNDDFSSFGLCAGYSCLYSGCHSA